MASQGGFHDGEIAVQLRAGVRADAARLEGMVAAAGLSGGAAAFLAERELLVLTGRDGEGRLWTSPVYAERGFLQASPGTLHVAAGVDQQDPLHDLPPGQQVGLLAIDLVTRRRLRVNGTLDGVGPDGLVVSVEQAFGNCPKYIQQRVVRREGGGAQPAVQVSHHLDETVSGIVRRADTFFLGTVAAGSGTDSSHRGGAPGFVSVDGDTLSWPDYPGNNLFNSFGNLAVDDTAALLVLDFAGARAAHLSGTAQVEWAGPDTDPDTDMATDGGTGRRVRFVVREAIVRPVGLAAEGVLPSPDNP